MITKRKVYILSLIINFMNKKISRRAFAKDVGAGILGLTIPSHGFENKSSKAPTANGFIKNARSFLGKQYMWNGRLTKKNPGLDCLGLIFLTYAKTFGNHWWDFNVNPSKIINNKELGFPVKGLDGILSKNVTLSKLKKADVIYLLSDKKINDSPIAKINGINYWPWHTGIYTDESKNLFIEANPYIGKVVEKDFKRYLNVKNIENSLTKGIFVTRIKFKD